MSRPLLSMIGLLLASGCAQGPYPTGRVLELSGTSTVTTKSFKITGGGPPVEQKGTIGDGQDCAEARASSGKRTSEIRGTRTTRMEVVGQTRTGHPLLPGDDGFDPTWVSIVEAVSTLEGETTSFESFVGPGADSTETREEGQGKITEAATFALAADEYLVKITSLGDLWKDLDDEGGEAEEQRDVAVELLTRTGAAEGEMWPSLDGTRLYQAAGVEPIETNAGRRNALRVDVEAVMPLDPAAGSVLERCVTTSPVKVSSSAPGGDVDTEAAYLDPGCEGAFLHQKVGSEFWAGPVKVAEDATTWSVVVDEYGYERYESFGGSCTRIVSTTKDDPEAELFVQYTVTTTSSSDALDAWLDP